MLCKDQVNDKSIAKLINTLANIEENRQERESSQRVESVTKAIDEESNKQGNVQKLVNQYQPTWVQVGQVNWKMCKDQVNDKSIEK